MRADKSYHIPFDIWRDDRLTTTDKLVYGLLAGTLGNVPREMTEAWISIDEFDVVGVERDEIIESLRNLERIKLAIVRHDDDHLRRVANGVSIDVWPILYVPEHDGSLSISDDEVAA